MVKQRLAFLAAAVAVAGNALAGGLLTNTNQNVVFLRNPARDAAIGIDGVYSNRPGWHSSTRDSICLSTSRTFTRREPYLRATLCL